MGLKVEGEEATSSVTFATKTSRPEGRLHLTGGELGLLENPRVSHVDDFRENQSQPGT